MNPAILYERFSPRPIGKADKCESLETQHVANVAYCQLAQLAPVETITDPLVSARKTRFKDRPGGQELLRILDEKKIRDVVTLKLARIFRSTEDGLRQLSQWERAGVRLHLANEGGLSINTSTAKGKLVTTFLLGVAAYEPEETAERTSTAMKRYQQEGRRMSAVLPYGYKLDFVFGQLVEDEAEQAIIREIRLDKSCGATAGQIARTLTKRRVPCRGGDGWYPSTVRAILTRSVDFHAQTPLDSQ